MTFPCNDQSTWPKRMRRRTIWLVQTRIVTNSNQENYLGGFSLLSLLGLALKGKRVRPRGSKDSYKRVRSCRRRGPRRARMSDDQPVYCAQCGQPIPEWYLKISAGIWCQNCAD